MRDISSCPLCGGRAVYQGFTSLECATAECPNGRAAAAAAPANPVTRALAQFALGLSVGQQWMDLSTGQLYEITAMGSSSVELDACFLRGSGQWTKQTVALTDLADTTRWRYLPTGPATWLWPQAAGSRRRNPRP